MKIFVVRLNPDPRIGRPYTKYITKLEYNRIHSSSPMDGFHEAVNFLPEKGLVRGYLPPKHLKSMRNGEPFALVTITAKTAIKGNDLIIGLQSGCIYAGSHPRWDSKKKSDHLRLTWNYFCKESGSTILKEPVSGARALVLGRYGKWVRGPTFELKGKSFKRFVQELKGAMTDTQDRRTLKAWLSSICRADSDGSLWEPDESVFHGVAVSEEGKKKLVTHLVSERDARLAKAKKADVLARLGTLTCEACGFNFKRVYGKEYGEAHHLRLLSKGGERKTSLSDLAILCANCHRMIHQSKSMMSVEKFRLEFVRKR